MWTVLAILSFLSIIVYSDGDVVELNVDNFEHLTQLNSGATTGDWFIKFYAPWCGHCKRLAPTWEEVATELKGIVNVAKVDVTQNRGLGKQFGVKGFPTLLLFRKGKMMKYTGARTKEAMSEWAQTAEPSEDIPGPLPITEVALSGLVKQLEDLVGVLNKFPVPAIILVFVGILIGIMLGAVMCSGSNTVEYRDRSPQANGNAPPQDKKTKKDQ